MKTEVPALRKALRSVGWAAFAVAILWMEHRRALRPVVDNKLKRDARNLLMAGLAAAASALIEVPVAMAAARAAQRRGVGLLQVLPIPRRLQPLVAILMLDYTLYIWHRLTHRVPVLWRFHRVHHIDREMDASTGLRFHFGEITLSAAFRGLQMWVIGPTPAMYANWQALLLACILFHHANIRLPLKWERRLAVMLVTPRLHAIHHSCEAQELNSNWSSGLTVWDWLHGTLRTSASRERIVIGVPGYLNDHDVELGALLRSPFAHAANVPAFSAGPARQALREPGRAGIRGPAS